MAEKNKDIVYCMETIVDGLVKIGITSKDNFDGRMSELERNGYANVTGLKKSYAIYSPKAKKIEDKIKEKYKKERIGETELYSFSIFEAIEVLLEQGGEFFYSAFKEQNNEDIGRKARKQIKENRDNALIPNEKMYWLKTKKGNAVMEKNEFGMLILKKGSYICESPTQSFFQGINQSNREFWELLKNENRIINGKAVDDIRVPNVSCASSIVKGNPDNGWESWKAENGMPIDQYRKTKKTRKRK